MGKVATKIPEVRSMWVENPNIKPHTKALPKEKLIELLSKLPDGSLLVAVELGNLVVLDAAGEYRGYVDFLADGELSEGCL